MCWTDCRIDTAFLHLEKQSINAYLGELFAAQRNYSNLSRNCYSSINSYWTAGTGCRNTARTLSWRQLGGNQIENLHKELGFIALKVWSWRHLGIRMMPDNFWWFNWTSFAGKPWDSDWVNIEQNTKQRQDEFAEVSMHKLSNNSRIFRKIFRK